MYQTILTNGFCHQKWPDSSANGGCELVQILAKGGKFYIKYVGSNGRYTSESKGKQVEKIYAINLVRQAINRCNEDQKNGHRRNNFQVPNWAKGIV